MPHHVTLLSGEVLLFPDACPADELDDVLRFRIGVGDEVAEIPKSQISGITNAVEAWSRVVVSDDASPHCGKNGTVKGLDDRVARVALDGAAEVAFYVEQLVVWSTNCLGRFGFPSEMTVSGDGSNRHRN